MTIDVNARPQAAGAPPEPLVITLLESRMHELRSVLYRLSEREFPGLKARHYRLLSFVPPGGERLTRMGADAGLTKQALAQALAPLEAGGYVEVVADPSDGRARIVRLTDLGRRANETVRETLAEAERHWAERVGTDRWATARAVLADLRDRGGEVR